MLLLLLKGNSIKGIPTVNVIFAGDSTVVATQTKCLFKQIIQHICELFPCSLVEAVLLKDNEVFVLHCCHAVNLDQFV